MNKKKQFVILILSAALDDDEGKISDGISFSSSSGPAWAGSERDYTYDEVTFIQNKQICSANLVDKWTI